MHTQQPNNPLHGKTLQQILSELVDHYGWSELSKLINIRCFYNDPSIKSSLKFLRKTPWARTEVEQLYISLPDNDQGVDSTSAAASVWAKRKT